MPLDTRTVFITLGVDAAVAAIVLLVFSILRAISLTAKFYNPNRRAFNRQRLLLALTQLRSGWFSELGRTWLAWPGETP